MSTSNYRWGTLKTVSADKGPYKLATMDADGKELDCQIIDMSGMQTNPLKDSQVFIISPDGDEGRAVAFVLPPPAKRVDQQKEGEATFINHKSEQYIALKDGGHIEEKGKGDRTTKMDGKVTISSGGILHLNPPG